MAYTAVMTEKVRHSPDATNSAKTASIKSLTPLHLSKPQAE